eukprot:318365-Chlamydomonas_euryale.AAC.11
MQRRAYPVHAAPCVRHHAGGDGHVAYTSGAPAAPTRSAGHTLVRGGGPFCAHSVRVVHHGAVSVQAKAKTTAYAKAQAQVKAKAKAKTEATAMAKTMANAKA